VTSGEWREKEFEERSRSSAVLGSAEPSGMQNTQMTVVAWWATQAAFWNLSLAVRKAVISDEW